VIAVRMVMHLSIWSRQEPNDLSWDLSAAAQSGKPISIVNRREVRMALMHKARDPTRAAVLDCLIEPC